MLYQYTNDDGKIFNLAPHNNFTIESENIFTTIVGQNGTGKSRLLKSILEDLIKNNDRRIQASNRHYNMIAISPSPYDKFPILNYPNNSYTYLGLRGLYSPNMSKSYLSKIIFYLLSSLVDKQNKIDNLMNILDYLNYEKFLNLKFEFVGKRFLEIINEYEKDLPDTKRLYMLSNIRSCKKYSEYFFNRDGNIINNNDFQNLIEVSSLIGYQHRLKKPIVLITNNGICIDSNINLNLKHIMFMLKFEILKLKDVFLEKKEINQVFSINNASSGEQSIIMSMLGIASKIENGSLICIDEPEVCLHPAWQEKYIKFLMNTFKDYKGCHFLIATHSPQITSKLEDENCYVMSMDDGKLVDASTLNNKSIDFQLAHVFKSPGFKNEYLTRELISLITLISEGKGQEELYSSKITEILALKDVIDDDDPVKELIKMVESVKKEMS